MIGTFAGNHRHPGTGESLGGRYVRIPEGFDLSQAHEWMDQQYGAEKWAWIYPTEDAAGVSEYGLHETTNPRPQDTKRGVA